MRTFKLTAIVTVSAYCEVEANTLKEAIEKSKELPAKLSFNGSGNSADTAWLVEEIDGVPTEIRENR